METQAAAQARAQERIVGNPYLGIISGLRVMHVFLRSVHPSRFQRTYLHSRNGGTGQNASSKAVLFPKSE
jgi:hypothetical protein